MENIFKSVKIKNKIIKYPIIQGGMGVGISLDKLATASINAGIGGTISAAQPGYKDPEFWKSYAKSCEANQKTIKEIITKVRENTSGEGFLSVNILTASRDYAGLATAAVEAGADAIISGAGLPIDLPKYTMGSQTANIPIVSSSRVLNVLMRKWERKYQVQPDAVIVEGPKAGGHLGIKYEEIGKKDVSTLEERFLDVKQFMNANNLDFPVFVAGGVFTHEDIKHFIELGADGVQIGTRFIATNECDADLKFKEAIVNATQDDIVYVKSPVGYPGRAIRNKFTEQISKENEMPKQCISCILPCQGRNEQTPYCITEHLSQAVEGDVENGLIFSGENGYLVDKITSVSDLVDELLNGKAEGM